jgi:hypothetical protein
VNITWYLGLLVLKCTKMIWVACDPSFFKRGLDAYCDCFWGSSCCVYMCLSISEMPCFITVFVGHCKNQRFWHANKMQPLCTSVCSTTNQWDRSWKYPTILGNCFGDAAANGGRRCSCPLDSIYIYTYRYLTHDPLLLMMITIIIIIINTIIWLPLQQVHIDPAQSQDFWSF